LSEPDHRSAVFGEKPVGMRLALLDPWLRCQPIPRLRMPKPPIHRPLSVQGCLSISSPQTAYLVEYQTYPEDQTETMEEDHLQGSSWAGRMRKFRAGALGVH
jgi:hypothetical protein